jgi:hypothetical protein
MKRKEEVTRRTNVFLLTALSSDGLLFSISIKGYLYIYDYCVPGCDAVVW